MPPKPVTEFAPAKVNLTLHVTGQRGDGYHLLDSLVVFCGIGDWVSAQVSAALTLEISGPQAHLLRVHDENLVLRAARAMATQHGRQHGAALTLDKHLPVASGIGGGSADAAATLRVLARLWAMPVPDAATVLTLGADVPVCLSGHPARMRGIGDRVDAVAGLPEMHIVLVNPGVAVPTPAVFQALATKQNPAMPDKMPHWTDAADLAAWLASQRNDLQGPACAQAPVIETVLAAVAAQKGAMIARMSGSGATCFGLFASAALANQAAGAIAAGQPQWWVASGPVMTDQSGPAGKYTPQVGVS